jgi:diaminopimelate decarboxylase
MIRRNASIRTQGPYLGRPPGFVFSDGREGLRRLGPIGELRCEQVSLVKLAKQYGTPLYVYSARTIRERFSAFERAFHEFPHTICYSVKANSNLGILRLLSRQGCGFDVVSGGELERALIADRRAAGKVVFSGVGKTRKEMLAALKARILLFNVESESELNALAECAARSRSNARIALRVNPDVAADTHPYISTGLHKHKFGVPIAIARSLYAKAAKEKYLQVAGVSVHIGSQITDVAPFAEAVTRVADLVRELRSVGHDIRYVDAGGGLGIAYQNPEIDFEDYVSQYARAITRPLRGLDVHLLLEPGRAIMGPAGALLTAALYRKQNGDKRFLIVDAAMNDLIRPALYSAHHEIVPVSRSRDGEIEPREIVDVVGPICESGDALARDRELPRVEEGDLLAILDVGAYGMVLASNYNTRPRAAEVLVSGKSVKLIRRRETIRDLLRNEQ